MKMTPEEQELLRKVRSGELVYVQENLSPANVLRTPLPTTAPKQPPEPPKQAKKET
ncbi:hypothetical protein [Pseudomonas orientalis]|uniref:hypothetical protein n=1 Tax=Pseudomonas orientalis TaxID=76758 RepID=UPI002FE043D4